MTNATVYGIKRIENSVVIKERLISRSIVKQGDTLMINRLIVLKIFGQTAFLFGLLGWFYGVLIQLIHPEFLSTTLSHLTPWIRVDTFTMVSFVIALIGFIVWRFTKEQQ